MTSNAKDRVLFLDLKAANGEVSDAIEAGFRRVRASGHYVLGAEGEAFEAEFAAACGSEFCVAVGNGLDALRIALMAQGVKPGDEVIVPAHTFIASWLAVSAVGAVVVPVDVDPATCLLALDQVEAAITSRTACIMPVHLYGRSVSMTALRALAEKHGLLILEDAAQAHGALSDHTRIGSQGTAAWSFYPGKNLGALGDAGAVTTDDHHLATKMRLLRNYGSRVKYEHTTRGLNSRLDELQASVLRAKLPLLDEWNERRRKIARSYCDGLHDLTGIDLPPTDAIERDAWHLFVIKLGRRDDVTHAMSNHGVQTAIHYPVAIYEQAAYKEVCIRPGQFPVTDILPRRVLSLPIGPHMTDKHVARVVDVLTASVKSG